MKRTLIALTTAVAVAAGSMTATPAAEAPTEQPTSAQQTTEPPAAETESTKPSEPKKNSSIGDGSSVGKGSSDKDGGWSPTGSTPLDLVLIIAGALGISFLVQPFVQGNFDQVINDLKRQFNLPM